MDIQEPTNYIDLYNTWHKLDTLRLEFDARLKRVRQRAQGLAKRAVNKAIKDLGGMITYTGYNKKPEQLKFNVRDQSGGWQNLEYSVSSYFYWAAGKDKKRCEDFVKRLREQLKSQGMTIRNATERAFYIKFDPKTIELDLD